MERRSGQRILCGYNGSRSAGVPLYVEVEPYLLELHGGVDRFIEAVQDNFGTFLTREALVAGETPRDINGFPAFTKGLRGISYNNALLMA